MKKYIHTLVVVSVFAALILSVSSIHAENQAMETTKEAAKSVGQAVGGTLSAIGKTIGKTAETLAGDTTPKEVRDEIDELSDKAIKRVLTENAAAKILYEKAYGYAVFDTKKISLLLTTGYGAGVVVEPRGGRTYMKMATAGAGLGYGAQFFQLVFMFENKSSLEKFINHGWEGNAAASAVFGKNSLEKNARFVEGMAVYQLNDAGIMADLNITGTKYWKSDELNQIS